MLECRADFIPRMAGPSFAESLRQLVRHTNGNGHGSFVDLNASVDEARRYILHHVNEFFVAVWDPKKAHERTRALQVLSEEPPEVIAETLMVYLQHTNGFDRMSWFPGVVDELTNILEERQQQPKAGKMHESLWNSMTGLPLETDWMPMHARDGIMRHLETYVQVISEQATGGTLFTHPEARSLRTTSEA